MHPPPTKKIPGLLAALHLLLCTAQAGELPGVIVHELPVPSIWQRVTFQSVYTASPSIVVLPDGALLITCNHFGRGSGASDSGLTLVYRSEDKGASWRQVASLDGMKRGSLFVHGDGAVYLLGFHAAPGNIVIRRSGDGGFSWTHPDNGLLREGTFGGTPNRPVVHNRRIWWAVGGCRFLSAVSTSDLLHAGSWTLGENARIPDRPYGENLVVTEAQVVASPESGPVLLPKVKGLPRSLLIRGGPSPQKIHHPSEEDWIELPGGEKKFAATWDAVSGLFIALTNPVLDEYAGSGWPPELIRNAGGMLVSEDLRNWRVTHRFVETKNVDYEAFQYFSFDFDGDDLVIASRTAFQRNNRRPPRGHDSNLITFHRITNFRSLNHPDPLPEQ